jgi:hypothetical protein
VDAIFQDIHMPVEYAASIEAYTAAAFHVSTTELVPHARRYGRMGTCRALRWVLALDMSRCPASPNLGLNFIPP